MKKFKVGDILYSCSAYIDEDNKKVEIKLFEWVIRTIRAKKQSSTEKLFKIKKEIYVFAARKTEFTWVKDVGKDKPYYWASSISALDKIEFPENSDRLGGLSTTKLQAYKKEIEWVTRFYLDKNNEDYSTLVSLAERAIQSIQKRINKLKNT